MSKGFLRTALSVASIAVAFIPGIGLAVRLALTVGMALAQTVLLGPGKPKGMRTDPEERLHVSMDATTPRKIVFGHTALATDLRYQTYDGEKQQYYHQVLALASHAVESVDEVWLENELAWTLAGGVQGRYVNWLQVQPSVAGNAPTIDAVWDANANLTGCANIHLRFKLHEGESAEQNRSVFAAGVPSRITVRGKGAKVYDPRLDSTVPGGSGAQRAGTVNCETSWRWDEGGAGSGENIALQLLFFLLGWRINNVLAVGMGLPPARIDLPSFITAANICDEAVTLNAGGTEKRYKGAGIISEGDDRISVVQQLCSCMNATLRDSGGKISLHVMKNDLATPKANFTTADILGDESWEQTPPLNQSFNVQRGRYIDPSDGALYVAKDFPEVSIPSLDGIERPDSLDYPFVQSSGQAQRLAKQRLQRNQYQGRYSARFGPRAWQVSVGDVVTLNHDGLGFVNKLFRVLEQVISRTGETRMSLIEENYDLYLWDNDERPSVQPGVPTVYDPTNDPILLDLWREEGTGLIGILTNPTQQVNVNTEGTITTTYNHRAGAFLVYRDSVDVTSQCTFEEIAGSDTGGTFNIDAAGIYDISAITSHEAKGVFRATYPGLLGPETVDAEYKVTRIVGTDFMVMSGTRVVKYGSDGLPVAGQTISWNLQFTRGIPTVGILWEVFRINADGTETPLPWSEGVEAQLIDTRTGWNFFWMNTAQYDAAIGSGVGVRARASITVDGVEYEDSGYVYPVSDGADGSGGIVAMLTNESHTLPANPDGTVLSYSGATGGLRVFVGTTDISPYFTLTTAPSGNPQALTVSYNNTLNPPTYTVTGGYDNIEEAATLTVRATGSAEFSAIVIDKVFTLAKSKGGANAVLLYVISDRQSIACDPSGVPIGTQTTTFTAQKLNAAGATVNWTMTDLSGTSQTGLSASTGDSVTLTAANFNTAAGATRGVIVTGSMTVDGVTVTDKISVLKVQDGVDGADALVAVLTNESHTLPADSAGVVTSYTGATGAFQIFSGTVDVSSSFTLSTPTGGDPQGLTESYNNSVSPRTYTVSGGLDSGEDAATLTIRATGSGDFNGVTIDKTFSLAKSKAGGPGEDAILLYLMSDRQLITYNNAATPAPDPSTQTTTFTAQRLNSTATVTFTLTDLSGNAATGLSGTGLTRTLTASAFNTARGATKGVIVTASMTDGVTVTDKISVVMAEAGAVGDPGQDAVTAELTVSSFTIPADSAGTVTSGLPATGFLKFYYGGVDVSSSTTFSEVSESGCTGTTSNTAGATKGQYSISAMSADNATYTLQGSYTPAGGSAVVIQKTVTLAKAKAGAPGTGGSTGPSGTFSFEGVTSGNVTQQIVINDSVITFTDATVTALNNAGTSTTGTLAIISPGNVVTTLEAVTDNSGGAATSAAVSPATFDPGTFTGLQTWTLRLAVSHVGVGASGEASAIGMWSQ